MEISKVCADPPEVARTPEGRVKGLQRASKLNSPGFSVQYAREAQPGMGFDAARDGFSDRSPAHSSLVSNTRASLCATHAGDHWTCIEMHHKVHLYMSPFNVRQFFTAISLVTFGLAGCAPVVKPMTTPDGKQGFLVACNGSADDWASCYTAAANACKGQYTVIDRTETSTPTGYGPLVTRNLIAECKR